MLCKKCNTAVGESASTCGYCGARVKRKNSGLLWFVWIALLAAAAAALMAVERMKAEFKPEPSETAVAEAATPIETEKPAVSAQQQSPEVPVQRPAVDDEMSSEQVWRMVQSAAIAANTYNAANWKDVALISKNGYFYDADTKEYVHPDTLVEKSGLNKDYAAEQILFLYMRPVDLNGYDGFDAGQSEILSLFAAYETKQGFAVATSRGPVGFIPRERLQELLNAYNSQHGELMRPARSSAEFYAAVGALRTHLGFNNEYDVRYLAKDSRYAVIVFSARTTPEIVEMYILEREENVWRVALSGLEQNLNVRRFVNSQIADINLDMLPSYSLFARKGEIRSNFTAMLDVLAEHGITEESDGRAVFITGTDEFCYAEFENGKRLLGIFTADRGWVMYPVENFQAGEQLMRDFSADPPYFLIKQ